MRGIASALESQQIPSTQVINWLPMSTRSVLALEGGTPGDLDFRFKMNSVLRSTRKGASKIAHLRRPKKATVVWEGTKLVPLSTLEQQLEDYSQRLMTLRGEAKELADKYKRTVPLELRMPESEQEEVPAAIAVETTSSRKFTAIQEEQQFNESMNSLLQENHYLVISKRLLEDTIAESQRTLGERLRVAKKQFNEPSSGPSLSFDTSEEAKLIRTQAFLPKLVSAVQGMDLSYYSRMEVLPPDYPRLAEFITRHGENHRWFAPQEAVDAEGKPLPLTQRFESLCTKNLGISDKTIKSINRELREALAWRWLIISHNHVSPKEERVKLPVRLSTGYERKNKQKRDCSPGLKNQMESIRDLVAGFAGQAKPEASMEGEFIRKSDVDAFCESVWELGKWLTSSYAEVDDQSVNRLKLKAGSKPAFDVNVKRWNELMHQATNLSVGDSVQVITPGPKDPQVEELMKSIAQAASPVEAPEELTFDEAEWEATHPESFDKDGMSFFRFDIDLIDIAEGQTFVSTVHNGVEYRAVSGSPSGPAKSQKAKGKTSVKPVTPKEKKASSPNRSKGEGPSLPPLAQENPLHVKGEAKSKALSDAQRKDLRAFFKLKEDRVPSDEWNTMDNKAKGLAMKERSIPRWASEAVLRAPANLQSILEGKLTKENANSAARVPKVATTVNTSQALEAWQQLKSDFKGTPLLRSPQSAKEKAFKKRFDQLVVDYGQQSCFPKLRERPDQQGRSASRGRGRAPGSDQFTGFIDMAKAFGEIARAFSGK
jgi:hypothetical protein